MAKEIVKYDNFLNKVSFKDFSENDFNLLMCLCARLRDVGEEKQIYDYEYLMDLIEWDKTQRIEQWHNEIKRMTEKIRKIGGTFDVSPDEYVTFNLFTTFRGNKQKRQLTVQVNKDFKYILNDITKNFTRFELSEYVRLNGRYTKQLYQNLKQFRKTGWWQVTVTEIRQHLSIPDSMPTMNIKPKILNPSIENIRECKGFSDLEVEVLRSNKRGRAVEGYKFVWTAEKQIPGQMSLDDYVKNNHKRAKGKGFNDYTQSTPKETIKELEDLFLQETNKPSER